jgi:hypothetical protein
MADHMLTAEQKEYLREHIEYELLMLRYDFAQMHTELDQLDWNAYFIAFVAAARNLYSFLTNDRDPRNWAANNFIPAFHPTNTNSIAKTMNKLRQQVLHLGTTRKLTGEGKVELEDCQRVNGWLERNMERFVDALNNEERGVWIPDAADPSKVSRVKVQQKPTGPGSPAEPTASNNPYTMLRSYKFFTK